MKTSALATVLVAALGAGSAAAHDLRTEWGTPQPHSHPVPRAHAHPGVPTTRHVIHIDCYRGPFRETIWDHPRQRFIEDLVTFGYDNAEALALATRVCRDVTAVDNPEALRANLLRFIAETPPGLVRGHGHGH